MGNATLEDVDRSAIDQLGLGRVSKAAVLDIDRSGIAEPFIPVS